LSNDLYKYQSKIGFGNFKMGNRFEDLMEAELSEYEDKRALQ
jgi:hypothetical protein